MRHHYYTSCSVLRPTITPSAHLGMRLGVAEQQVRQGLQEVVDADEPAHKTPNDIRLSMSIPFKAHDPKAAVRAVKRVYNPEGVSPASPGVLLQVGVLSADLLNLRDILLRHQNRLHLHTSHSTSIAGVRLRTQDLSIEPLCSGVHMRSTHAAGTHEQHVRLIHHSHLRQIAGRADDAHDRRLPHTPPSMAPSSATCMYHINLDNAMTGWPTLGLWR